MLILFICTSDERSICREKIMSQYEVCTNEKYKVSLYLYIAKHAKSTQRLILFCDTDKSGRKV